MCVTFSTYDYLAFVKQIVDFLAYVSKALNCKCTCRYDCYKMS